MWNYSPLFASIPVLLIFLIFFMIHPRLSIRINRVFVLILLAHTATIIADYFATKACEHYLELPVYVVVFTNLLFFICFIWRILLFYQFTLFLLRPFLDLRKPFYLISCSVFWFSEAVTVSSIFTGAVFFIDSTGYHPGPFYYILYVCAFFYCGLSLLLTLLNAKQLTRFDFLSIFSYNAILLTGYIVRLLLPKYLIMSSFCLMAIIIIYLAFENPDYYISDRGKAFNRKAFLLKLEEIRHQPYRILAFAIHDYNGTRGIYGGRQMDLAIRTINAYIADAFPQATVFYLNNGCYAILCSIEEDSGKMCEAIRRRFHAPWVSGTSEVHLDAVFVQTVKETETESADKIISTLLAALDVAAQGLILENADEIPDNIHNIDHQIHIRRQLEYALDQNSLEVFLQPIFDAGTKNIIAAEALVRVRDDNGRLIPPGLFIPIAEKSGYINRLGQQVFEKVCSFIREYPLSTMGLAWINVNLSPIQCMSDKLADDFEHILIKYDIPADAIHLEITEQTMDETSVLKRQIKVLHRLGFQFALDDYGSGYSNLLRLKRYPFNNIKLDMELVWDYVHDRDYLIPGLVHTFKSMDLTITAEGIEDAEMAQAMADIGCDYLQGYYFSRPIPISEFINKYSVA